MEPAPFIRASVCDGPATLCPVCFAAIPANWQPNHNAWHDRTDPDNWVMLQVTIDPPA